MWLFFCSYSFPLWCIAAFKMVITFLDFSRCLFTVYICPHLHLREQIVHVTCQHASTNCTITVNTSALNTDTTCPSDRPVCTYKYVWYHNTMTTNWTYYKPDKAPLSGQWKWKEVVTRFEVMSAVLHKHINPEKQTFRVSKDCDIKQAPWSVLCRSHITRISCLRVIEHCTGSENREAHCVLVVLIPLIRNP
jgi:hypothetical protein